MAHLIYTGADGFVDGHGLVRTGETHDMPDDLVAGLLATTAWQSADGATAPDPQPEAFEPAPDAEPDYPENPSEPDAIDVAEPES